jgi:hypothetical protein
MGEAGEWMFLQRDGITDLAGVPDAKGAQSDLGQNKNALHSRSAFDSC